MPKRHIPITPSILYFGTPVVLLVTCNEDGSANITPISSAWALGQHVILGLGAMGRGTANLLRTGECTLNFPSADLWSNVERIARTTGLSPVPEDKAAAGYIHCGDKFALSGLTRQASMAVRAPRIIECPLQMEARLLSSHRCAADGDLEPPPHFIVEVGVLKTHAHNDIVIAGTDHIDPSRWTPLFYVFRHYFGHAVDLGSNFRSEV